MQEELLQMKTIEKSLAVFCLATYGEGDPTDNAMEFWEWIQGDVDLAGLNYAVSILEYILFVHVKSMLKFEKSSKFMHDLKMGMVLNGTIHRAEYFKCK